MNSLFPLLAFNIADSSSRTKMIWAIVILVLFVFVILGVVGMLTTRLMRWQGRSLDKLMYKVTITRVIQNKRHFQKIALIKTNRYFFKQVWIPLILMLVASIFIILYCTITNSWGIKILTDFGDDTQNGRGLLTIFYVWDFNSIIQTPESGAGMLIDWPTVLNTPHFTVEAWQSYVFFAIFSPGLIWFLIVVQCYLARLLRLFRLSRSIYDKNLEKFRYDQTFNSSKGIDLESLAEPNIESTETPEN